MRRIRIIHTLVLASVSCGLAACGGAVSDLGINVGNQNGIDNSLADGYFRDSIVSGLHYVAGTSVGDTGTDGGFKYQVGQPATFSLGGVTFGTADDALASVTPLQLVDNGTLDTPEVLNITRFLMMLDTDNIRPNGINISSNVRAVAADWAQVDFTQDLDVTSAPLVDIISDVATADNVIPVLPDQATARVHLNSTLTCLQVGVYRGQMAGDDAGIFGFYVDAITGALNGFVKYNASSSLTTVAGAGPVNFSVLPFSVQATTPQTLFSVQFTTLDQVDGTTNSTVPGSPTIGTLSGGRLGGDLRAALRFVGTVSTEGVNSGVYYLDGMLGNSSSRLGIKGQVYDMLTNTVAEVEGNLDNGTELSFGDGDRVFLGTVDPATARITQGFWNGGNGNNVIHGEFTGDACQFR